MKKNLIVLQEEISDCGVCCLLSIMRYYNTNASLEELRIDTLTDNYGVSAYNLIKCAKSYGFDAKGIKTDDLPNTIPYIAHLKINESLSHFVVVYEIKKDKVLIMDPSYGSKSISINEFKNTWTKKCILFTPRNINYTYIETNIFKDKILKIFFKNKKKLIILLILSLLSTSLSILSSFYITFLHSRKIYIIIFFSILIILKHLINYIINIKTNTIINISSKSILLDFYKHIFRLPLKYIHIKDSGEIIKRVDDLESIKDITVGAIINYSLNIVLLFSILTILRFHNTFILHTILFFVLLYISVSYLYCKHSNKYFNKLIKSSTEYKTNSINYISSLNSIIMSSSEDFYLNSINNNLNEYVSDNLNITKYNERINLLKNIILSSFETFLITYYVIFKNNIEDLLIVLFLFNILCESIESITNYFPALIFQKKIIHKISDFYNIKDKNKALIPLEKFCHINISNLSYSYNYNTNIINNLNYIINKGDKIFIRGKSGAGKSTLLKILYKELDYKGSILINNIELNKINTNSLRNKIIYVSQDEHIINGTIKDNILMGKELNWGVLNNILEITNLNSVIEKKPFKLDTYLFGGASELSGGEKNLLYLARALYCNPDILILDETLKELDTQAEINIINNLLSNKRLTLIYVSHKDMSKYFDRVLNM